MTPVLNKKLENLSRNPSLIGGNKGLGFFDSTNDIGCGGIKGVKSVPCQAYSVGSEDNV